MIRSLKTGADVAAKSSLRPSASATRQPPTGTNIGVPGVQFVSVSTQTVSTTRMQYAPFFVTSPVTVEAIVMECTTAPGSTATMHAGIYRADQSQQPYGPAVADVTFSITTTGVYTATVEVPLAPGEYVTTFISDVALSVRYVTGACSTINPAFGATPSLATIQGPGAPGALVANPVAWDATTYSSSAFGVRHPVMLRWRDTQSPILVHDGDSLTNRSGVPYIMYPEQILRAVSERPQQYNFGVSGQGVASMLTDAATQIDPIAPSAALRVLVAWGGTNDLGPSGAGSMSTLETNFTTYCTDRRTAGYKIIVLTLLPRGDGVAASQETARATYNTWLRANYASFSDALVDVGADSHIGAPGAYSDLTYYSGDNVHPNTTGLAIVAGLVLAALKPFGIG